MEGVFIPKEILEMKDLTSSEKIVLALYKYYTDSGKYKCCTLSKPQIAKELGISIDYIKNIKKHLKDLGYISTDGGIKVTYLGVKVGDITPSSGGCQDTQGGGYNTRGWVTEHPQVGDITPGKWVTEHPHKKEKEEKKDKKEIKKEPMTNLDLLLDRLPDDYKTPERIEYIKTNLIKKINEIDFTVGGSIDSCIPVIKDILNQVCPMDYHIVKEEPINNTVDVF